MRSRTAIVCLALALTSVSAGHAAASQLLYAYFDQDGNIQFRYADSSNVGGTILAGSYTVNLNNNGADDEGVDHIFHLFGPGVDYKAANVDTQATFTATFQTGATYTIQDALHPNEQETFVASTIPAPPPTVTTTTAPSGSTKPTSGGIVGSEFVPFRGALDAIVYAGGRVSLARDGRAVKSLKTGRYTFSVDDESHASGFTVQALHGKPRAITSASFVGSHDLTVTLKPGRWFFFGNGKKTTFFVVS